MTTAEMFLIRRDTRQRQQKVTSAEQCRIEIKSTAKNESFLMKTLVMAMMLAALGVDEAADVVPTNFSVLAMTIRGGILGMIIGISCVRPKDVQSLAQEIFGNLACAIAFSGILTPWIAARTAFEPNENLYVAVSAGLGICGLSIVKAGKSEAVDAVLQKVGLRKKSDDSGGKP